MVVRGGGIRVATPPRGCPRVAVSGACVSAPCGAAAPEALLPHAGDAVKSLDRVQYEAYLSVNTHKDSVLYFFQWLVLAVRLQRAACAGRRHPFFRTADRAPRRLRPGLRTEALHRRETSPRSRRRHRWRPCRHRLPLLHLSALLCAPRRARLLRKPTCSASVSFGPRGVRNCGSHEANGPPRTPRSLLPARTGSGVTPSSRAVPFRWRLSHIPWRAASFSAWTSPGPCWA